MTRVIHLSRARIPEGRAVVFAKALQDVSTLTGNDAVKLTNDLYDTRYELPGPIPVRLKEGADTTAFERLCENSGIVVRTGAPEK